MNSRREQITSARWSRKIRDATQQVEETRLMAERTTYLATRIPILAGRLGDIWMSDLVKNQNIKTLLAVVLLLLALTMYALIKRKLSV